MAVDLKNHPGRNPDYDMLMADRLSAMSYNRQVREALRNKGVDPSMAKTISVPKQPNKYIPHIGAKQRAKAGVK